MFVHVGCQPVTVSVRLWLWCVCSLSLADKNILQKNKNETHSNFTEEKDEYEIERKYHIFRLGHFPWHFRCFIPFFILSIYQIEKYVWISEVSVPHTPSTFIYIWYRKITLLLVFLVLKSAFLCGSILLLLLSLLDVDSCTGCVGDIDFIESTRKIQWKQ